MAAINLMPTLLFTGLRTPHSYMYIEKYTRTCFVSFIYFLKNQCKKQSIDKIRRAENEERKATKKLGERRKKRKDKNILFIHPADYSLF